MESQSVFKPKLEPQFCLLNRLPEPAVVPVQDGVAVEQVVDAGMLEDLVPVVIRVRGPRHSSMGNKSAYHS